MNVLLLLLGEAELLGVVLLVIRSHLVSSWIKFQSSDAVTF